MNHFDNITNKLKVLTIKDIAKEAGVSICTISRVLNDSELVAKKTRKKVKKIIDDLNFIPNEMARGLLKRSSKSIALIIPDISNPFFSEMFYGIEDFVNKKGYSIFLCNTDYSHEKEKFYIKEMVGKGVDGIIIISTFFTDTELIESIMKNVRVVTVQTQILGIDGVITTDDQGTVEAIEYLIKLGHTKIAYVCLDIDSCRGRYEAYIKTLKQHNIPVKPEYFVEGYLTGNLGYLGTNQLLNLPDPPTAIQVLNDYTAFGCYKAIMERGLKIPSDISVVGFDDISMAKLLNPALTTVSQPIYAMGESAADLLLKNIIDGPKEIRREVLLPTEFIVRDSAAPPKNQVKS